MAIPDHSKITKKTFIKQTTGEKHKWSQEEKLIIKKFFHEEISKKNAPKKHCVMELYNLHPNLDFPKNWATIKVMVQNIITKKLKA